MGSVTVSDAAEVGVDEHLDDAASAGRGDDDVLEHEVRSVASACSRVGRMLSAVVILVPPSLQFVVGG